MSFQKNEIADIGLYEDTRGVRYTTHCFAQDTDPWHGAYVLTERVVEGLRAKGLLPLTPVPGCSA